MGRALAIIKTEHDRQLVAEWLAKAKIGTRIEFRGPKRTLPQNDRMWAMLTDIVRQHKQINGRQFSTEEWKCIFLQAAGAEPKMLPTLDGLGFFATSSSSILSVQEASDVIECMFAWGAEVGMAWSDPEIASYSRARRD
jgi:hypothetical protein